MLKPFTYALALDQGLIHEKTVLIDSPIAGGGWAPDNADGSSAPTPELKTPRTKKELEDALGTVNESGKWTPPAGSHIDPKTGNILNKDGVVVGTTQEPYSKARPGSQG